MFDGQGMLDLEGDHLDISFRSDDSWPAMTPAGSIKNYTFGIGDPTADPLVQLGLVTSRAEEPLDWRHVVDPPHFHGTDQFRILVAGTWVVGGRRLRAGDFLFQEAGKVYREHPASEDPAWIVLVIGDRRGALPTIISDADKETVIDGGENFRPADPASYAHPAGPRGVPSINTNRGPCTRGYLHGSVCGLDEATPLTGTFGDSERGPSVELVHAAPGQRIRRESVCGTEQFLVVTRGSANIASATYTPGDMRVQHAGEPMPAIIAGSGGCEITIAVADRRDTPVRAPN